MTFIDFFAGVGGFRKGMENAGHTCVGFCEWDKYARASYISMHLITDEQRAYLSTLDLKQRQKEILKDGYLNGEFCSTDVRLVTGETVPRADCYCFGAPCQDFSVAGRREGLSGDRSSLVREIFRILGELEEADRPEWLIYENVKGMLSSNQGRDYLEILMEMDELGYDAEWFVFNSKYHGVPQNRERVYTVGHFRGRGPAKVFLIKGADREDRLEGMISENNPIGGLPKMYDGYNGKMRSDDFAGTLTQEIGNPNERHSQKVVLPVIYDDYNGRMREDKVSCTLTPNTGSSTERNGQKVVLPVLTPDRTEKKQNGRRIKENGDPAFTLTSEDRHGVAIGFNTYDDGTCRTLRAQTNLFKPSNLSRTDSFGASGAGVAIGIEGNYMPSNFGNSSIISPGGDSTDSYGESRNSQCGHGPRQRSDKARVRRCEGGQDSINLSMPESRTRRGRVGVGMANTLDCGCEQGVAVKVDGEVVKEDRPGMFVQLPGGAIVYAVWYPKYECYVAIRKLTPRECFRLQGWEDEYFDRAEFVNSDSQLYKQAGNGVTVNVVELIGRRLAEIERGKNGQESGG